LTEESEAEPIPAGQPMICWNAGIGKELAGFVGGLGVELNGTAPLVTDHRAERDANFFVVASRNATTAMLV
jgi:hypothetical protein